LLRRIVAAAVVSCRLQRCRFQVYAGINNFTDQKPDLGETLLPTEALGRSFYLGAKVKLARIF
jgi:hypothetical protein